MRKRLLWLSCERAVCCVIHALPTQDPLVGTITLRLINEDDWKAAVREVVRAHMPCRRCCASGLCLTRCRARPQVDKHVECTFGRSGFSSVAFEEAYWTVSEVDAAAPPEGPEQGFNDRVAQPRAMPVVSLRLRFPTRAAFERFAADLETDAGDAWRINVQFGREQPVDRCGGVERFERPEMRRRARRGFRRHRAPHPR